MNQLTIGKKIGYGFGMMLGMFVILSSSSFMGVSGLADNAKETIELAQLNTELAQREIDHLLWASKVSEALFSKSTKLSVEVDPRNCGFGKWYYGAGRDRAEKQFPKLSYLFSEIENPHKKLHKSATAIQASLASGTTQDVLTVYTVQTLPNLHSVRSLLNKIRQDASEQVLTNQNLLMNNAAKTRTLVGVTAIIAILSGAVLAFCIDRGITLPLHHKSHLWLLKS